MDVKVKVNVMGQGCYHWSGSCLSQGISTSSKSFNWVPSVPAFDSFQWNSIIILMFFSLKKIVIEIIH